MPEILRSWKVMRRGQPNIGTDGFGQVVVTATTCPSRCARWRPADTSCTDRHLLEHTREAPALSLGPQLLAQQVGAIIGAKSMGLRLRLVVLLMLPLLLVSGVYSVVRVQQEAFARVQDERERAARMAGTIQIAVENALALR